MEFIYGKVAKKFNPNQLFFLDCWSNMVKENGLDSYRVRISNPCSIIREIAEELQDNFFSKTRINLLYDEFKNIFNNDEIIRKDSDWSAQYEYVRKVYEKVRSNDDLQNNEIVIKLLNNLYEDIKKTYDVKSIDFFIFCLKNNFDKETLHSQISNFLSFLIYKNGQDIGSLFVYWKNLLLSSEKENDLYRNLNLIKRILTERDKVRCTIFSATLEGVEYEQFPFENINKNLKRIRFFYNDNSLNNKLNYVYKDFGFEFNHLTESEEKKVSDIISYNDNKIFIIYISNDIDGKVAGNLAFEDINRILDLLSFDSNTRVNVCEKFCFIKRNKDKYSIIDHKIDDKIPNPPNLFLNDLNDSLFNIFLKDFDSNSEIVHELSVALKFYRQGKESNSLSEKLVNWWTAIEHLVITKKSNIGETVSSKLSKIVGSMYLKKQIDFLINNRENIKKKINFEIPNDSELVINIIKNKSYANVNNGYFVYQLDKLSSELKDDITFRNKLESHINKTRSNIYRIYKARCAIVHNHKPILNLLLLCSYLEVYLKTLIYSMTVSLESNKELTLNMFFLEKELLIDDIRSGNPIDFRSLI